MSRSRAGTSLWAFMAVGRGPNTQSGVGYFCNFGVLFVRFLRVRALLVGVHIVRTPNFWKLTVHEVSERRAPEVLAGGFQHRDHDAIGPSWITNILV